MSSIHLDSDCLADSALGVSPLSERESEHLDACAECRLELELVRAAARLGSAEVAGLPEGRIARRVVERLAAQPVARPRRPWLVGLAAAAALALAVWYGSVGTSTPEIVVTELQLSVLHELDDLNAPELEQVLESIPLAAGAVSHQDVAPLVELNVSDLERVLRSMEE
jgi:hypothetical protein